MHARAILVAIAAMVLAAGATQAAITVDTVAVGDPGNTGELSGASVPGGNGADRICGAVSYAYNIGKYEVTAGQYAAFLNAVAKADPYGLYTTNMHSDAYGCQITRHGSAGSYTYDFSGRPSGTEADWANRPVNYVSFGDAMRFANWLHNGQPTGAQGLTTTEDGAYYLNGATTQAELLAASRKADWKWAVTSEDEWYKAAYYKGGGLTAGYWDYATGSDTAPGRDMADASGNNANYYTTSYLVGSPYYRTLVGEFQNSESPYGTYDQAGNVREWNESTMPGLARGVRGGVFGSPLSYLNASFRDFSNPTGEIPGIGFRVVQMVDVPEPATIAVLVLGSVATLMRRRGLRARYSDAH